MDYKFYSELPKDAKKIREEVFIIEQGFKNEFDEIDIMSIHLVIYIKTIPVATARLYQRDKSNEYVIGRVAVLSEYRKEKLGTKLLELLENKALELGAKKISLSAQYKIKSFYEKQNYKSISDVYYEEHCKHIKMEKELGGVKWN